MKHLKKFNESSSMELEDYFVEFTDEGFSIERKLNEFTLKYTGEFDFNKTLEMYNDVITKLQAYGKDITKTDLSYKKFNTKIIIEVKNVIKTGDEIEITLRGEKLRLYPHAFQLYGNYNPSFTYRQTFISSIILFCKDENNSNYNITWEGKPDRNGFNYKQLNDIRVKVQNTNISIDLENTTKVFNIIKDEKITARGGSERMIDVFSKTITPELLTK